MRNRCIVGVLAVLLILVLGVPAVAGGPNDNGEGYRLTYRQEFTGTLTGGFPICKDGEMTDDYVRVPDSTVTETLVGWQKADWQAGHHKGLYEYSVIAPDGSYKWEAVSRSHDHFGGYHGNATTSGTIIKIVWSDPHGRYASAKGPLHWTYASDGELRVFIDSFSGWVCLRDTILP